VRTRAERIDSLLAIRALHERYGHIQEVIIQNFLPKTGTRMAKAAAAPLEELAWTVSVARILFGPYMSIQAPPNLNPGVLGRLVEAGVNDWGGVSPLTPDYVNPEAPWPEIERLRNDTALAGKTLTERLTIYPSYARAPEMWLDPAMRRPVLELSDGSGRGREDSWRAGRSTEVPQFGGVGRRRASLSRLLDDIVDRRSGDIGHGEIERLFEARDSDFAAVCAAADHLRASAVGNVATYVVNRNINYTNICTMAAVLCLLKGQAQPRGRGKALSVGSRGDWGESSGCLGARRYGGVPAGWHSPEFHR